MNCNHHLFCVAGLYLAIAYDDISYNKDATQSHTYVGKGYEASNAVDGNIATCIRTMTIGSSSVDKTVWWKVDLGGVYNIYSIKIFYKNYDGYDNRQRGRFAGFSLYVSNTGVKHGSTLCYKDGSQLPPLNFTTVCTESGRYVIFYNERLDGVAYPTGYEITNVNTELCEVTVQGCNNASFYGSNCNTHCPINCKDSTCHILNGTCFTCKPGWTGIHCDTKCKDGWHGINCNQRCTGHCRDGVTCNHVTSHCDRGCDAGWTGSFCNKACVQSYGENCRYPCSPHCYNQTCDRFNGRCLLCCTDGFHGELCDKGETERLLTNQNMSSSITLATGLSVSLLINLILIVCGILLCRRIKPSSATIYQDTFVKTEEASTYQELNLSDSVYHNTTTQ